MHHHCIFSAHMTSCDMGIASVQVKWSSKICFCGLLPTIACSHSEGGGTVRLSIFSGSYLYNYVHVVVSSIPELVLGFSILNMLKVIQDKWLLVEDDM